MTMMLENTMVKGGDYYASPDEVMTCPTCHTLWERYGSEWETIGSGAATTDKRPVVGHMCRACAWCSGCKDESKILSFVRANGLEKDILKHTLVHHVGLGWTTNDLIWDHLAQSAYKDMPDVMAAASMEYITDEGLKDEYIDYVMGV